MTDLHAKKDDDKISVRVTPGLKARIKRVYELHRIKETELVTDAVTAALDYIEREGKYVAPVRMIHDPAPQIFTPADCPASAQVQSPESAALHHLQAATHKRGK